MSNYSDGILINTVYVLFLRDFVPVPPYSSCTGPWQRPIWGAQLVWISTCGAIESGRWSCFAFFVQATACHSNGRQQSQSAESSEYSAFQVIYCKHMTSFRAELEASQEWLLVIRRGHLLQDMTFRFLFKLFLAILPGFLQVCLEVLLRSCKLHSKENSELCHTLQGTALQMFGLQWSRTASRMNSCVLANRCL